MEKKSNINIQDKLDHLAQDDKVLEKYDKILRDFLKSYEAVIRLHGMDPDDYLPNFASLIDYIQEQFHAPFQFEPYHKRIRTPIDYYKFGIDFLRPLVDLPHSTVNGLKNLDEITRTLARKENVIVLANHQIEADPHAISILLERSHPQFAEELIFVAGTRVLTDPLAIPFSMGRNLLCIHAKKYIDTPPEKQHEKQLHNKRTMELMGKLLSEGGHAIYVAPSGGRDRINAEGIITVAPFDPQSIEMLYLMTKKAKRPTHFYPLTLSTYHLLPPPETTDSEVGETRVTHGGAIHLAFGSRVDMEHIPGVSEAKDKHEKRKRRAEYLWGLVNEAYKQIEVST